MNKLSFKKAFTLIELIVASALLSVIILGLAAVNNVLNNNQQDFGQKYLVNSATQSALNNIVTNAGLAVGSGACNNEPFLIGGGAVSVVCGGGANGLADPNTFCIHQGPGANILNNGANDLWLCYQYIPASNQIKYCTETYNPGGDPRGAKSCTDPAVSLIGVTVVNFLGSANSITTVPAALAGPQYPQSPYYNPVSETFTITIQDCFNNTANTCGAAGTSADPADNPEVQLTATASPFQVSS